MKKNISINISGIIFHIEEDGYERLKAYLESINRYFSTFEDSEEIIADIESRIAEIFLSRLREGKQVITSEDVEQLMTTMGSIRDFQSVEDVLEDEKARKSDYQQRAESKNESYTNSSESTTQGTKRLYRDENRKVLGGVAAGIAHYFGIDPLWVRLLFVILLLDLFVTFSISSLMLISYIICWIVIPGSRTLEEDKKIKRLYRDPDDRVLGGVSSGLAAYFGTDPILIRILFILLLVLGGSGFLIYIVLWVIMPPAKTLTEKMQMQGEPVTLSNIEQNIRKSLNVKDGEENLLIKIILFPFRLIAVIFKGLGSIAGPLFLFLGDLLRILLGVLLVILGLSFFFSGVGLLTVVTGLADPYNLIHADINMAVLMNSIPMVPSLALLAFVFVLSILMMIGGLTLISKKSLLNPVLGWTMLSVLIVSLLVMAISIPATIRDFQREGTIREIKEFALPQGTTVIELGRHPSNKHEEAKLSIKSYEGDIIQLEQEFEARGRTIDMAEQNAGMIEYRAVIEDSVLTLDQSFDYKENAVFRNQRLRLTLYIPEGAPFRLDRDIVRILDWNSSEFRNYTGEKLMYDENGELTCMSCPEIRKSEPDAIDWEAIDSNGQTIGLQPFSDIQASAGFTIRVIKGDKYSATVSNDPGNDVAFDMTDDQLSIRFDGNMRLNDNDITEQISILLTMPEAPEELILRDQVTLKLEGFEQDALEANLENEAALVIDGNIQDLRLDLSGNSLASLSGRGEKMNADLFGSARLNALAYECGAGEIETSGTSQAHVYISQKLEAEASGSSEITYKGDCSLDSRTFGSATVRKYQ
ncbi:PspC domain-containing protein [Roseivirga sp. BDSF3-8]|uniref:PspC domain-containing protein n=1 Tax=Roseivirga sp. BDSF3-8 TaxID=3241598 RepID=UPI003531E925